RDLLYLPDDLYAAHAGHGDIENQQVGFQFLAQPHRLLAIAAFGNDLDVVLIPEKLDQSITNDGMRVGNNEFGGFGLGGHGSFTVFVEWVGQDTDVNRSDVDEEITYPALNQHPCMAVTTHF